MNKDEPKHYLFDRFDNVNYEGNKINLNSENLEDEEFINKMDIQLEKLESKILILKNKILNTIILKFL